MFTESTSLVDSGAIGYNIDNDNTVFEGVLYTMPEISLFYGIRVTMYYRDHMPPHFHAEYNGKKP